MILLIRAAKTPDNIEEIERKIGTGKCAPQLADINDALRELRFAKSLMPKGRTGSEAIEQKVRSEFDAMFNTWEQQFIRYSTGCASFVTTCEAVLEAVESWKFDQRPWIRKGKKDADREVLSLGHIVETANCQYKSLAVTASRLGCQDPGRHEGFPKILAKGCQQIGRHHARQCYPYVRESR